MVILLNGVAHTCAQTTSVATLLEELRLEQRGIAVARNSVLVPHSQYATVFLAENDELEIIQAVAGG